MFQKCQVILNISVIRMVKFDAAWFMAEQHLV